MARMSLERRTPSLRNRTLSTVAFLTAQFLVAAAHAQTPKVTVSLDPAATAIHWTLSGNTHTTHGTFRLKGGQIVFDPATGEAQGEVLVDLTTGESGNSSRDSRMQADVLESAKYPQASFHPTRIVGVVKAGATQTLNAEGTFTIHGADHRLELKIQVKVDGNRATATTHFSVPYVAWGMKDPSTFLLRVGKEVAVDVVAEGTVEGLAAK
jgi:polyisoprenoid-binding protein YceI